jgi:hypothetical protein
MCLRRENGHIVPLHYVLFFNMLKGFLIKVLSLKRKEKQFFLKPMPGVTT